MTSTGVVQNVTQFPLGAELVADTAAGDLTLFVDDGADFAEGAVLEAGGPDDEGGAAGQAVLSGGGLIRVGGDDPNAEIVRYTAITEVDDDDEADFEPSPADVSTRGIGGGFGGADEWYQAQAHPLLRTDGDTLADDDEVEVAPATITLDAATPLTHAWPAGTRVDIWDTATNTPATEWRALCRAASDTDNTDAVDAVVNFPLVPLLPEGVRDEDHAELVTLDDASGDWRVTDVISRVPSALTPFGTAIEMAEGRVTVQVNNALNGSATVSFPPGRFSANPTMTVASTWLLYDASVTGAPTVAGATVSVRHLDGLAATAAVAVHWMAVNVIETS